MILELLVLIACVQGDGCPQTTSAYFNTKPEVKKNIKNHTNKVKEFAGPTAVGISPVAIFFIKKKATFNLSKHLSLEFTDKSDTSVIFKVTF